MLTKERKNGIVLSYITMACTMVISLFFTPVLLKHLGQAEYGTYSLSVGIMSYLSLCGFGLSGSYLRFYSQSKEKGRYSVEGLNALYLLLYVFIALFTFIAGLLMAANSGYILGGKLTASELKTAGSIMYILALSFSVSFLISPFSSILIACEKHTALRVVALTETLLRPLVSFVLLIHGYRSVSLVILLLILTLCELFFYSSFCIIRLRTRFAFKEMPFFILRELGLFSLFVFINTVVEQINWNVDRLLLGRMWGSLTVAVYAVAAQINGIYTGLSNIIISVFEPKINSLAAHGDDKCDNEMNTMFKTIGRVQFALLMLALSGFAVFGRSFIRLWVGDGYEDSYYTALLLMAPMTIPLAQNTGLIIQRAKNKHYFRSIVYLIIAVLNIIISIPLCRRYSSVGCAAGTAIGVLVGNVLIMNIYYKTKLGLDTAGFWKQTARLLPPIALTAALGAAAEYCAPADSAVRLLIYIVAYTLVYLTCMWLLGIRRNEREQIKKLLTVRKNNDE